MKKTTIDQVNNVKEWNGGKGTVFYHDLTLDNGDKINIGFKERKKVGTEITYEITGDEGQHEFTKAKSANKNWQPFKGKSDDYTKGIEVGHAINNAVNMICAGVEFDDVETTKTGQKIYEYAKHIMVIAEKLKNE